MCRSTQKWIVLLMVVVVFSQFLPQQFALI